MQSIARLQTPYKLPQPVLEPSRRPGAYDSVSVDVPFVFSHNDRFYMLHVGFDGRGYQTALAAADSPLGPFQDVGLVLRRGEGGGWDSGNAAGVWLLSDDELFHTRKLKKVDGKYWMYYHSYPEEGYEAGPAAIGMAWCADETLLDWHRLPDPILTIEGAADWEAGGLYKNCVVERDGRYYLFYNAKTREGPDGAWREQTGLAVGSTPFAFARRPDNPLLTVSPGRWDSVFVSDPWVVRDGDDWVMFYYGFDGAHAREGVAFSKDLAHWEKYPEPLLEVGAPGALDDLHAHKPALLWHDGTLYHYYCCCRRDPSCPPYAERRAIAVATSRPFA